MLKRSVDVALALLLLIITLPLLAVAAALTKLDSDGPVLFRQVRMGRGFKPFFLLKLRTMRCGDRGSPYTFGADPRITGAGRLLRRIKLDELPQLWNVLRGEMSMVGPRPVIPELTVQFRRAYERLLQVRPGLTDPATLKYFREAEMLAQVPDPQRHFMTVVTPDKLRISQAYLERANGWRDLGFMIRTALTLLVQPWQPQFREAVAAARAKLHTLLMFTDSEMRRRDQPNTERLPQTIPVELPTAVKDSRDLLSEALPSRLAEPGLGRNSCPQIHSL